MDVVVVGGGSAGWITALKARKALPNARITLVESSEVGILGAGEGTTPQFISLFLNYVGISVSDVVRHTGGTVKNGIKFTNWRGDGTSYYHPFDDQLTEGIDYRLLHPDRRTPDVDFSFSARVSEAGRVPVVFTRDGVRPLGELALHFDARRLAAYLRTVAESRGITRIDGYIVDVREDDSGDVRGIVLRDGRVVPCDFVFDCSGFARLLIGKHFGARWRDLKKVLPVDRAVPFELPHRGARAPYTEAVAMSAGWCWLIPVQERIGCGYVYDSDFQDDEGARAEIRARFGADVALPRVIPFRTGYYDRLWVRNVVAVGLSSGFLEPIEATSIWMSIYTLRELFQVYLPLGDDRARADFNRFWRVLMQRVVDFLYLHYVTPRADTPFWATFDERTERPPIVAELLGDTGFRWMNGESHLIGGDPAPFRNGSFTRVALGNGIDDRESLARYWRHLGLYEGFEERRDKLRSTMDQQLGHCATHEQFLDRMR